jgi:CheY-like chemotaxis protein
LRLEAGGNVSHRKAVKALIVEDQESFRQAVVDELKFLGFETAAAVDGAEALELAQSTSFDLILSDIRMPNRDGRWLLNELRKIHRCTPPFIFMTGFADLSLHEAFAMGADGFLGKPIDSDKLAAILAKVCSPLTSRWTEKPRQDPGHRIAKTIAGSDDVTTGDQVSLGRGGMFLAFDAPAPKVNELVSFDIHFETGPLKRLEGIGTVVWKRDQREGDLSAGCGIAFDYIAPSSLPAWLALLGKREMIPVIPKGNMPNVEENSASLGA